MGATNTLISIGNSDDPGPRRLTQRQWSEFIHAMRDLLTQGWDARLQVHGEWFSGPDQPWQNANWAVEVLTPQWWRNLRAQERAGQRGVISTANARVALERELRQLHAELKEDVRALCLRYSQDSFAWTTGPVEIVETGWLEQESIRLETATRLMTISPDGRVTVERIDDPDEQARIRAAAVPLEQAQREGWLPTALQDNRSRRQGGMGLAAGYTDVERQAYPELDLRAEEETKQQQLKEVYLNDDDRMHIQAVLKRNREDRSTPGEEPVSAPQQPASTTGDEEVSGVCTQIVCLIEHALHPASLCVLDSPGNRMRALEERWDNLKPAWREHLGLRHEGDVMETAGITMQPSAARVLRQKTRHEELHVLPRSGATFEECQHADCVAVRAAVETPGEGVLEKPSSD